MLRTKLLILAVALVAIVCTQTVQAYPPAGIDVMNTSARVDLYDPGNTFIETVNLTGRVVVTRSDPYDPGDGRMKINTVMDTLYMEGYSVSYGDSMYVTLNRTYPPATGYIQQITPGIDFPAESFFDVYYLITIGPPAPNPPKSLGTVRGEFHIDQATGEGKADIPPTVLGKPGTKPEPQITPIEGSVQEMWLGKPGQEKDPAHYCDNEWQGGGVAYVPGWFYGDECYAAYQDPVETGCPPTVYPFLVTSVIWYVYAQEPIDFEVQPLIYEYLGPDEIGQVLCFGPVYNVSLPGAGAYIITLPLDDTCCVNGPYYAGVCVPTYLGPGILDIVVDDGPPRSDATYNDWGGGWQDLVDDVGFLWNLELWSDGFNADQNNCQPSAQLILINDEVVIMADTIWHIPPDGREYKDPRKIAVYDQATGELIGYVWHKHVVDPPSGGIDTIPTTGTMPVVVGPIPPIPGQEPDEIVQLEGEALVWWGEPQEGIVETEIMSMNLVGESKLFGEAYLNATGPGAAIQTGEETFPAESFFDVYYQVDFPQLGQVIVPQAGLVHMAAEIESFPPYNRKYKPGSNDYSPMVDIENPGVIIGWVAPIHWVRPQTGACCDLLTGGCTETTPEDCTDPNELFLGIGVPCDPNPCPDDNIDTIPTTGLMFVWIGPSPPQPGQPWDDAIYVEGDAVVSWDEVPGAGIETEIVSMDLTGNSRLFGEAHLTLPSPAPGWVSGTSFPAESFFDVYYEVDLPDQGIIIAPSDSSPHMVAEIDAVPPIPSEYLPDPPYHAIQDIATGGIIGWVRPIHFVGRTCCILPIRGDVNYDGAVNVADLTYLVDYLFFSGQPPPCPPEADVDGSGAINVADLTYLVDYLFFNGPPPAPC